MSGATGELARATGARATEAREIVARTSRMTIGEEWIAGDHAVFAFRGIPCIAVTSSNLLERVMQLTHTAGDTREEVDSGLLDRTAAVVAEIVSGW
jgi:aminopeptidase YwaD